MSEVQGKLFVEEEKGATRPVVTIWEAEDGWCVQAAADRVYVYQTMRSALRAVESTLKKEE